MPQPPQVEIGVLITKDDQVLLMKRTHAHGEAIWSPPGGHLGYGESLQECALREARSEIGMLITEVTFLAITNDVFDTTESHTVTIWIAGRYVSEEEPTINTAQAVSEVNWFSWDALPGPLFLPFERLLTGQCYPALWDFSGGEKP